MFKIFIFNLDLENFMSIGLGTCLFFLFSSKHSLGIFILKSQIFLCLMETVFLNLLLLSPPLFLLSSEIPIHCYIIIHTMTPPKPFSASLLWNPVHWVLGALGLFFSPSTYHSFCSMCWENSLALHSRSLTSPQLYLFFSYTLFIFNYVSNS